MISDRIAVRDIRSGLEVGDGDLRNFAWDAGARGVRAGLSLLHKGRAEIAGTPVRQGAGSPLGSIVAFERNRLVANPASIAIKNCYAWSDCRIIPHVMTAHLYQDQAHTISQALLLISQI
jgi:hypothetical protein